MTDDELKALVNAFLAWPLPADVAADAVACKPGAQHRTGTNLLTGAQACAMFTHCLALVRAHDKDELAAERAKVERLRDALGWYGEMAKEMGKACLHQDSQRMLHLMKELSIDYGKRAALEDER